MPEPLTKLMLVCQMMFDGDEESNYDLFVVARDRDEAIALWREYYKGSIDEGDEEADAARKKEFDKIEPDNIRIVPIEEMLARQPRAIPWHKIESV